ncbi:hypothetical protein Hanom_Chr09g00867631 [Helianthus anomalus]
MTASLLLTTFSGEANTFSHVVTRFSFSATGHKGLAVTSFVIFLNTDLDDFFNRDENGVCLGRGVSRNRFLPPSTAQSARRQDTSGDGETKKSNLSTYGLTRFLLVSSFTEGVIFILAKRVSS